MKRVVLYLALNSLVTLALAFLTAGAVQQLRHITDDGLSGWLMFTPFGTLTGFMPVAWLLFLLLIDSLWLFFLLMWGLKHMLHIKGKDNTLYLP